jgi:hypothetical protein
MWRSYAAWMDGALESDIALIESAMRRVDPAIDRGSGTQIELTLAVPVVAGLGTRLATRRADSGPQVLEKIGLKKVAERVGFERRINNLLFFLRTPIP